MDNVGLILWDGTTSVENMTSQHSMMRGAGINRICVVGCGQTARPNSLITLYENKPIGSYAALVRGVNYCEMSMFNGSTVNQEGVFIHYADEPLTLNIINKIMQISTICSNGSADIVMALRLVDDSSKPKYAIGHDGTIQGVQERSRGHENFGTLFIKRGFLKGMPTGFTKIHEFIDWAVKNDTAKIYGAIISCSK
jgi:hypothetical protein